MGYTIDPLQGRWNALGASVISGSVWAIWHIPAFIQAHDTPTWIVAQCLLLVATRILMVWIYNNAGKSIFALISGNMKLRGDLRLFLRMNTLFSVDAKPRSRSAVSDRGARTGGTAADDIWHP